MRSGRDYSGLDLYGILGVGSGAAAHEIRSAYRRKVRESHPDLHPDDPRSGTHMRDLNLAARVLLDPVARAAYDRFQASPEGEGPKNWWERASADDQCDWVDPPLAATPEPVPLGMRGFLQELRGTMARALLSFDGHVLALPPRGRLLVGSLGVGLALILLAAARPRLGGDRPQPVSISPSALYP